VSPFHFSSPTRMCLHLSTHVSTPSVSPFISSRLRAFCVSIQQLSSPTLLYLHLSVLVSNPDVSPFARSRLQPGCVSIYQHLSPPLLCLHLSASVSFPAVSPISIYQLSSPIRMCLCPLCVSIYQLSFFSVLVSDSVPCSEYQLMYRVPSSPLQV